jgi:hypothetical protein
MSLTIRFIKYRPKIDVVAEEPVQTDDPDEAFDIAMKKLREEMRYKVTPVPDGFIIIDEAEQELKRWVEKA